ncbi:uncharacterized protein LOC120306496 [Crotalus tigris]|uniref:uncharacterized protein LOC120306496 n=1 Tax=Crotalus tigris TaxID=88082 RepID=UPI00192FAAC7|nr:uncharacterized protein LOC120306496 [Crotalus tigris]
MDMQQLMGTLFNLEEREKIRIEVAKIVKPDLPSLYTLEDYVEAKFPSKDPKWNPYRDLQELQAYQQLAVQAVHAAGKPAVNMSKPSLVVQEATESPEAFYARLLEAYQMYTPIDPTELDNARMLAMAFISQSTPDIRRKLQRLEGALGKPMSEPMEVARKTFVNREKEEEKKRDQKMQWKAELLAVAMMGVPRGGGRGRGRGMVLGRNQCAICKREGHWKGECPEREREEEQGEGRGRFARFARSFRGNPRRGQGGRGRREGFSRTLPLIGLAETEEWD